LESGFSRTAEIFLALRLRYAPAYGSKEGYLSIFFPGTYPSSRLCRDSGTCRATIGRPGKAGT